MSYIIVHFHADGGQTCIPGRRVFDFPEKKQEALDFADKMRKEPNHACGSDSVSIEISQTNPGDFGKLYPAVADVGRHTE
jgi:hypothetical protein